MNGALPLISRTKLKNCIFFFSVFTAFASITFSQNQTQPDYANNSKYIETMSVVDKVTTGNNYAGNLNQDSLTTLPFGIIKEIGSTRYVIAIDSALFLPGIALYSAYMAIEFPGSTERLAFIGKNIAFNPKGVIPGNNTRLMLASDQKINIGPKIKLVLKADGNNYVEWDCNGFKAIRLKGSFEFNNTMLVPDPHYSTDSTVTATFDIYTNDVHNFITQVAITPFSIKGLNDVFFSATDATVDMSEIANAPGMVFPNGYSISSIGSDIKMWTGFYMKQFKIKLPKEISKNNMPSEISANNFFIDKSGVTGNFQASNLFSTSEGTMRGWGFSIDQLGLNFVSNNLNGGNLAGKILLPLNNFDGVAYTASVFQNSLTKQTDFSFSISPRTNYEASLFAAKIDIYPSSKLTIQKLNGTFKPSAELNGKITFVQDDLSSPALEMEHVVLITDAPYLKSGVFSFTNGSSDGASGNLAGFNISFNSINVLVNSATPGIGFNAGMSFTAKEDNAFGTSAAFNILTTVTSNPIASFAPKWKFDKVLVNDITLSVHTCAFKFDGLIKFTNNSPSYGKGFFGSMTLSIPGVLPDPATASVWFGAKNNFNYFCFDLAIPLTQILVPPTPACPEGLAIYRFMGGLYYKMKPNVPITGPQLYTSAFGSAQNYIPDNTISMGVKAGVTLGIFPNASSFNGDVALELNFTASGGIAEIKFSGNAFMFVKLADRVPVLKANAPVKVALNITYDFQNNILDALLNFDIILPAVNAHGQGELYIDPHTWYIYFGKPQNRVVLNAYGVGNLSAYIMIGNQVEPVPPPPDQVANIFGHGFADTRDKTKLGNGTGFSLGASLGASSNGSFSMPDFSVYYNLGFMAGFDVMAFDYGNKAHCYGSSSTAGFNGWYANGDVYAALWGVVGAKGSYLGADFDIQLLSLSAAAMLGGKFPNPSHVRGDVAVSYNFLKVFSGNFNFNFGLGNDCNIVAN